MEKRIDLLEGSIASALTRLALPLMGTSLIQMAYNLTDMLWIGRLGADAVASVGTAGMFLWLGMSLNSLARVGGQVCVGHSVGAGKQDEAAGYAQASIQMTTLIGLLLGAVFLLGAAPLISFFHLNGAKVITDAEGYLRVVGGAVLLSLLANTLTALITATGNSSTPFLATAAGLVTNMLLDPVLIFGLAGAPKLGVLGAAIATAIAQALVAVLLVGYCMKDALLRHASPFRRPRTDCVKEILKLSAPVVVQNLVFPLVAMLISRMVAVYGDAAIGAQKVGTQIESISWMTADGYGMALNSFIAQNRGAGNLRRANRGYTTSFKIVSAWGVFTTLLLVFCAGPIFRIFIPQKSVLPIGVSYLVAQGWSQLFMCLEIVTVGAFNGYGVTVLPAAVDIILTVARIPMAIGLSRTSLGLSGIWWSISISSIAKGVIITAAFLAMLARQKKNPPAELEKERV